MACEDLDLALALSLQEQFNRETTRPPPTTHKAAIPSGSREYDPRKIVDSTWELTDPDPNIHDLFVRFDQMFFQGTLVSQGVAVSWSNRMTLCAGVCSYAGREGFCSIRLSQPLLKLRPRRDLVQTLLHEMIHAYLFVSHNNTDHDGHGPNFQSHMNRINSLTGAKITIYHTFHDEVREYRQHWWKCDGPCQHRRPFLGMVKRAMNRPPSSRDPWWAEHQRTCGGTFKKIKEPDGYKKKGEAKVKGHVLNGVPSASKRRLKSYHPNDGSNMRIDEMFRKISSPKSDAETSSGHSELMSSEEHDSMRSKMLAAAKKRIVESERRGLKTEKRPLSQGSRGTGVSVHKRPRLKPTRIDIPAVVDLCKSPNQTGTSVHSHPAVIDLCEDNRTRGKTDTAKEVTVSQEIKQDLTNDIPTVVETANMKTITRGNREVLIIGEDIVSDEQMSFTTHEVSDGMVTCPVFDATPSTTTASTETARTKTPTGAIEEEDSVVVISNEATGSGCGVSGGNDVVVIGEDEFKTCPVCGLDSIPAAIINAHIAFCLDEIEEGWDD